MELRQAIDSVPDLAILWVMADNQINARTLRFIDENGLRDRVHFLVDADSAAIDQLGLRRENPEPIEEGVPHPTTYLIDRNGNVRFADSRVDFHIWLDPERIVAEIARLD